MGAPRKPTHLKVVSGSAAHDRGRLNPDEPKPALVSIEAARPPSWLRLSPLARRAWRDLVPLLAGMRVLTAQDLVALGLLCDSLASYVTAKRIVTEQGSTYETRGDIEGEGGSRMLRKHPAVEIGAEASRFAKVMLTEFGLTPASRARVSQVGASAQSPLDAWIEGSGS
jgi:P27 family predicted phage terminase small subunit